MDNNVEDEFEKYLVKWKTIDILYGIFLYFFTYQLVVLLTIIFLQLSDFFGNFIWYFSIIMSGFLSLIPLFRNKIILCIFRKTSHTKFIILVDVLLYVNYILSFIILGYFILFSYVNINDPLKTAIITLKIFTIFLAYVPIWHLSSRSIRKNGYVLIWIENELLYRNEFSKRQKWISKLLNALENRLKKGNLLLSKDKLLYHINIKLLEGNDINGYLDEIYEWILYENDNILLLKTIHSIMPQDELIYYKTLPVWVQIKNTLIENKKYIILLPLFYLVIKEPERGQFIIDLLKSLLSLPF